MPKTILVMPCMISDVDGAAAIPYAAYLNQIYPDQKFIGAFSDNIHVEAQFVFQELGLEIPYVSENENFDYFILVDASESFALPSYFKPENTIEVIDHRLFPDYKFFPNARFRIEPVGAAATQIAEFYYFSSKIQDPLSADLQVELDPKYATILLAGIYSNTNNFLADTTTFRDERMRDWLETVVGDNTLIERMFEFKTNYILENLEEVLQSDCKYPKIAGDQEIAMFQLEMKYNLEFEDESKFEELLILMKKLEQNRDIVLSIQDINHGCTWLYCSTDKLKESFIKSNLEVEIKGNFLKTKRLTMRKSLIPILKK